MNISKENLPSGVDQAWIDARIIDFDMSLDVPYYRRDGMNRAFYIELFCASKWLKACLLSIECSENLQESIIDLHDHLCRQAHETRGGVDAWTVAHGILAQFGFIKKLESQGINR